MTEIRPEPESKCINCCAILDLDFDSHDKEDQESPSHFPSSEGFFTLNCTSRIQYPLNRISSIEIPVGRALSTIFNLKDPSSSSRHREEEYNDDDVNKSKRSSVGEEESQLFLLLNDSPSLPICFVCHLILNDLYRTYTEFSQLRKTNSLLGSKLAELESLWEAKWNQKTKTKQKPASVAKLIGNLDANFNSRKSKDKELSVSMTAMDFCSERSDPGCSSDVDVGETSEIVKYEIFDEDELRDEMSDKFIEEDDDENMAKEANDFEITSDLPGQTANHELDPLTQIQPIPYPSSECDSNKQQIQKRKQDFSDPSNEQIVVTSNQKDFNFRCQDKNPLQSAEFEMGNIPLGLQSVHMDLVKTENAYYIPNFPVDQGNEECYPTDHIDPIGTSESTISRSQQSASLSLPSSEKTKYKSASSSNSRRRGRPRKTPRKGIDDPKRKVKKRINPINYSKYYTYIPNFATCHYCGDRVPRKHGNTNGLMIHLKNHHNIDLACKTKQFDKQSKLEQSVSFSSAGSGSTIISNSATNTDQTLSSSTVSETPLFSSASPYPSSQRQYHELNTSSSTSSTSVSYHHHDHSTVPQPQHYQSQQLPEGPLSLKEDTGIVSSKLDRKGHLKVNYPEHFEFTVSETGKEKAICKLCRKVVSRKNCNTTSMRSHLFNLHKMKFPFEMSESVEESFEASRLEDD